MRLLRDRDERHKIAAAGQRLTEALCSENAAREALDKLLATVRMKDASAAGGSRLRYLAEFVAQSGRAIMQPAAWRRVMGVRIGRG